MTPHLMFLVIFALLPPIRLIRCPPTMNTTEGTPSDIEHNVPDGLEIIESCPVTCFNGGICKGSNIMECLCPVYYTGLACEFVDLSDSVYEINSQIFSISWPVDMDLSDYVLFYMPMNGDDWFWRGLNLVEWLDDSMDELEQLSLANISVNDNTIMIGGLKGDATTYNVCVFHGDLLPNVTDSTAIANAMSPTNPNCITFETSYTGGIYSMVAKYVASIMGVSVILLFILRGIDNCRDPNKLALIQDEIKNKIKSIKKVPTFRRNNKMSDNQI